MTPISIHVPRVEDDTHLIQKINNYHNFNPRPPCGGRHGELDYIVKRWIFQSTSPVWRTTTHRAPYSSVKHISIHVPRVEDDNSPCAVLISKTYFNPRPPCGGRRDSDNRADFSKRISIHVPRVEDDDKLSWRSPPFTLFQSTSPVWRTTGFQQLIERLFVISIHVPPCGGRQRINIALNHPI